MCVCQHVHVHAHRHSQCECTCIVHVHVCTVLALVVVCYAGCEVYTGTFIVDIVVTVLHGFGLECILPPNAKPFVMG